MTVAVGIEVGAEIGAVGAEIGAGGRAVAGARPGQAGPGQNRPGQNSIVPALGNDSIASGRIAANGSPSGTVISGGESFRSNWLSMLRAWGAMPRSSGDAAGRTAIDEDGASGAGEMGAKNGQGLSGVGTEASRRSGPATSHGNGPLGGGSNPLPAGPLPASLESASDVWNAATTPQRLLLVDAAIAGMSAQAAEATSAADTASNASASGSAASSHRSNRGERRESVLEGQRAEPQAGSPGNDATGVLNSASLVAVAAAAPAQPQMVLAALPVSPTSNLADRLFSTTQGPASDASVAGVRESPAIAAEMGTAGRIAATASLTGMSARAASRNPVGASQTVLRDDESSEAAGFAPSEPRGFAADQQTGAAPTFATPAGALQEAHASQPGALSGGHGVQTPDTPAAGFGIQRGFEANTAAQSAPAAMGADTPSLESGAQARQQGTARPLHETAAGPASAGAAHIAAAQPTGAAMDGSAWARDPAGAQGTAGSAAGGAGALAGSSAGTVPVTAPQETFAALDSGVGAGTAVGTPAWIHAGGQRAEAGFEDPALGWVGVRADLNGGSVQAAVVPGSTEAAQALSGHLAGLNAYLAEQHSPVATLTMAAPDTSGMESGAGQNMQQSAGQHAEQNTQPAPQLNPQAVGSANAPASPLSAISQSSEFDAIAYASEGRGAHISVMA